MTEVTRRAPRRGQPDWRAGDREDKEGGERKKRER